LDSEEAEAAAEAAAAAAEAAAAEAAAGAFAAAVDGAGSALEGRQGLLRAVFALIAGRPYLICADFPVFRQNALNAVQL